MERSWILKWTCLDLVAPACLSALMSQHCRTGTARGPAGDGQARMASLHPLRLLGQPFPSRQPAERPPPPGGRPPTGCLSLFQDLLAHTAGSWVHLLSYLPDSSSRPQEGIPAPPPSLVVARVPCSTMCKALCLGYRAGAQYKGQLWLLLSPSWGTVFPDSSF